MKDIICGKDEAMRLANSFGSRKLPFFFVTDFSCQQNIVVPLDQLNLLGIECSINDESAKRSRIPKFGFDIDPTDFICYKAKFDQVLNEIKAGNSYLVNLTFRNRISCTLSLREIYECCRAKYKLLIKDKVVVFSPEGFISIRNNVITTTPMKGTIDAAIPNASHLILTDPKEMAEHTTVVDLLRNDISMVADDVKVTRFKYIDRISTHKHTILQVSSEITGTLPNDYQNRLGDIIYQLLPAGSISGAPKRKTVEIINEVEGTQRGFYTGIFGIYDGRSFDSGVMIRFIEKEGDQMYYYSGGGITCQSDARKEYEEMINKIYVPLY